MHSEENLFGDNCNNWFKFTKWQYSTWLCFAIACYLSHQKTVSSRSEHIQSSTGPPTVVQIYGHLSKPGPHSSFSKAKKYFQNVSLSTSRNKDSNMSEINPNNLPNKNIPNCRYRIVSCLSFIAHQSTPPRNHFEINAWGRSWKIHSITFSSSPLSSHPISLLA